MGLKVLLIERVLNTDLLEYTLLVYETLYVVDILWLQPQPNLNNNLLREILSQLEIKDSQYTKRNAISRT